MGDLIEMAEIKRRRVIYAGTAISLDDSERFVAVAADNSLWAFAERPAAIGDDISVVGGRLLLSNPPGCPHYPPTSIVEL